MHKGNISYGNVRGTAEKKKNWQRLKNKNNDQKNRKISSSLGINGYS
ncbi:hypothetical protein [Bartonella sp. AU18XJBT]|nr:hypothetical protein [Bartonella sp. AU18XJBT]